LEVSHYGKGKVVQEEPGRGTKEMARGGIEPRKMMTLSGVNRDL